ncbi:hypothetical protein CHS0354_004152 [Potamilus streckersoni]|uniref:Uncharacterized protein n=1 Tax=Potamilus streckersoni TaxID=2493646 RepID=A0AAE0SZP8_9BIVA|nr:hypothetical protein CHS0354_004152 [Potamilus streckersoni]
MSTQKENLLPKRRHSSQFRSTEQMNAINKMSKRNLTRTIKIQCEKSLIIDLVQPRPASKRLTSNINENDHVLYPMYTSPTLYTDKERYTTSMLHCQISALGYDMLSFKNIGTER